MAGERKYPGGYLLPFGAKITEASPWDDRDIVNTLNDLKTIDKVYPFIEIKVHDLGGKKYKWNGLGQANLNNWVEVGEVTLDQMNAALPDNIFFDIPWTGTSLAPDKTGQFTTLPNQGGWFGASFNSKLGTDLNTILNSPNEKLRGFPASSNAVLSSVTFTCRHVSYGNTSDRFLIIKYKRTNNAQYNAASVGTIIADLTIPAYADGSASSLSFQTVDFEQVDGNLITIDEGDLIGFVVSQNGVTANDVFFFAPSLIMRFKRI